MPTLPENLKARRRPCLQANKAENWLNYYNLKKINLTTPGFSCGVWGLVPSPVSRVPSLGSWTTRKAPTIFLIVVKYT